MTADLKDEIEKDIDYFINELKGLRIGRANTALVENIVVDYYGNSTPLIQLATITIADAHTIVIQPWDKNSVKEIEKAINKSDLGTSAIPDGGIIRISIPPMTEERRLEIVRKVGEKAEQARVKIRQIREDHMKKIKSEKDSGDISEDIFFTKQKEIQNEIDRAIEEITNHEKTKQEEITKI